MGNTGAGKGCVEERNHVEWRVHKSVEVRFERSKETFSISQETTGRRTTARLWPFVDKHLHFINVFVELLPVCVPMNLSTYLKDLKLLQKSIFTLRKPKIGRGA